MTSFSGGEQLDSPDPDPTSDIHTYMHSLFTLTNYITFVV